MLDHEVAEALYHLALYVHQISPKESELKQRLRNLTEAMMPKGTKVEKIYTALRKKGYSEAKSAKISQAKTGKSLKTGKKPKAKKK